MLLWTCLARFCDVVRFDHLKQNRLWWGFVQPQEIHPRLLSKYIHRLRLDPVIVLHGPTWCALGEKRLDFSYDFTKLEFYLGVDGLGDLTCDSNAMYSSWQVAYPKQEKFHYLKAGSSSSLTICFFFSFFRSGMFTLAFPSSSLDTSPSAPLLSAFLAWNMLGWKA